MFNRLLGDIKMNYRRKLSQQLRAYFYQEITILIAPYHTMLFALLREKNDLILEEKCLGYKQNQTVRHTDLEVQRTCDLY